MCVRGAALALGDRMRIIAVTCLAGCHVAAYGPTDITVTMMEPPALVAFRDASVGWTPVTPAGDPFVITVHGPYQVVIVCDHGMGFADIYRTAQTPDDPRTVDTPCYPLGGSHHDVTGTMVQPGHVQMGFGAMSSNDSNWSFDLDMDDDTYDLVAYTTDHVAVRRGIDVASAVAV